MPGKSKLTADAAEQAALHALSKSEQRGEADRARAILLTLEGRKAEEIAFYPRPSRHFILKLLIQTSNRVFG